MDPKLSQADPKVQEAYDRVMSGSSTPPPAGVTTPTAPFSPQVTAQPTVNPAPLPVAPVDPAPAPSASPVTPSPSPMVGSTIAFNANNAGKNQGTTVKRGGSKAMSLVLGVGIIVLLVAYTFVWVYVFKLKIPGLPF